jgi:Flp pilus assembly protein TadB
LVANLALIPRYGALGGAIGTTATLVVHNVLKQVGLRLGTGIPFLARRYVRLYGSICVAAIALLLLARVIEGDLLLFAAVAIASVVVIATNRRLLLLKETFPEFLQIPVVRRLFVRRSRVER